MMIIQRVQIDIIFILLGFVETALHNFVVAL